MRSKAHRATRPNESHGAMRPCHAHDAHRDRASRSSVCGGNDSQILRADPRFTGRPEKERYQDSCQRAGSCYSTYCDTAPSVGQLTKGQYVVITTTQSGKRFDTQVFKATNTTTSDAIYQVDVSETRQAIDGFGGAFTDAAGINIASLPANAQDNLISSYFGRDGLGYTIGRVPMASCDFSTHPYSYDDTPGDLNLTKFALAKEDLSYKIPYIKKAFSMSPMPIKMFGSPWSAPAWMKDNKNMTGKGSLIGKPGGPYYKTWANYFVRFIQEYEKHNISFWGMTAQNEPIDGLEAEFPFQCMGFTPEVYRDFIKMDLGPALEKAGYGKLKLMMLDDQRMFLIEWAKVDLNNWVTGWTDWNMALSTKGGPNWVSNFDDSPIIVNEAKKEFYKQPMFYVMGHFSKYLVPGSIWVKVKASKAEPDVQITAFQRPDKSIAAVIHNLGEDDVKLALRDGNSGYHEVTSPGKSIQTVIWS
ncbi:glucosylceramidase [Elysia marginata]|uniref:Glucosylceramidase n=1 Tax=Elysia marginata TaxID=1093978 RepID=A0AAV4IHS5_9GAST|nr:glucosylceramidase [Elysia marginata]